MVAGQLGAWAELIERGPPWRVGGVGRPPAVSFCSSQFLDWVLQPRFSCCLRGQKWSGVSWPLSVPVPECSVQAHGDVMTAFLESSSSFLISPSFSSSACLSVRVCLCVCVCVCVCVSACVYNQSPQTHHQPLQVPSPAHIPHSHHPHISHRPPPSFGMYPGVVWHLFAYVL